MLTKEKQHDIVIKLSQTKSDKNKFKKLLTTA